MEIVIGYCPRSERKRARRYLGSPARKRCRQFFQAHRIFFLALPHVKDAGNFFKLIVFFFSQENEKQEKFHFEVMLVLFKKKQVFYFTFRSSHWRYSVKKVVHRNFAEFTSKYLCQSLFSNKVALGLQLYYEFCKVSKNNFFTEHLRTTTSVF